MVEVARYITVNMVDVLIACVAKEIPLAKAFAVFVPGTLALIRRRGGTPEKRHVVHVAHESFPSFNTVDTCGGITIKMTSTVLNHRRTTEAD